MNLPFRWMLTSTLLLLSACSDSPAPSHSAATPRTQAAQAEVAQSYDLSHVEGLAQARRGLIATPQGQVRDAEGEVIWDFDSFAFIQGEAPTTVNPSLWRQALLNNQVGLFKVSDKIYQLRGFDLANMTLIEGDSGWIVIDPLTSRETAAFAMDFVAQHLGPRPVSAMIFSHSHVDHFGGALGVISAEDAKVRQLPVIAPAGFMEEATSENLMMGIAMSRRATFMYGKRLPRSAEGLVDNGLGKAVAFGHMGILPPTQLIDGREQTLDVDGVRFVFYNVPGSEAPAEMTFSLPELNAFGGAELLSQTLHNLYTLRGAKVRDALQWANYIDASRAQAAGAEVLFNQHHWPVWGQDNIQTFLTTQRDVYRYLHDQTVRLMNAGLTAPEIAEQLHLPPSLDRHLNVHGYYGTLKHNVRGIYQFYLGWFDANPANLDPLPPVAAAAKYVALAGGREPLLAAAEQAYAEGDYRWAAELGKHLLYADPDDQGARDLQARSFEQLGYQAESGPWRNFYLSGAYELRHGLPEEGFTPVMMLDMLKHTAPERFLDVMATKLDGTAAADSALRINLNFTDSGARYHLWIENAVLHHRRMNEDEVAEADASLNLSKDFFLQMISGQAGAAALLSSDQVSIDGNPLALGRFFSLLDQPDGRFPIVTR
ncbi:MULTISPECIES: alkyl/aryl-sulfatase [Pseudomonas]|jgi:alkyl sulfatase BDS1-like metallo-beta-lactamase superfamily hydrolase|uniref:alkyl/aryl-sulfatase n=1 Tax=Pseudomonas TaxID=286 RepID=UPI001040CFFB|nr:MULTISPECIES: alkyl sulfatase dimerization domain-containing protein [Pseudomonas]MBG7279470.1 MBL fold metallo-hydrolase [Pseudomonas aeruginosa]MDH1443857.1 MBL fold metallo-hydrolase [Pseudomonas sp. GD03722]MDI3827808.1 alkyl sulfatase dimerization domain-containing protein [Pseudomonas aeruginosa]MDU0575353.1 alkyl sulfatase dimerization domain-containing protein [Pseudomonas aeruginosa]MDU0653993.1 alkyl sulfatase dimerization domain-containing protein [Pseudomonas aeruginosa]